MGKTSKHEKYLVLISGAKSVQFLKNLGGSMITGGDLPLSSIHDIPYLRPSLLRSTVVFSFFVGGSGSDRCRSGSGVEAETV